MSDDMYQAFLDGKRLVAPATGIADPPELSSYLFPFQRDLVRWALKRGRAAIWADCGLGKSAMSIEWARVVRDYAEGAVLILTPLAVAQQFVIEGEKIGVSVKLCRSMEDVEPRSIVVTNYDRLHRFDPGAFVGVVADESSCLKDYTSATRNALIESFGQTPFRLACTATPAPNDFVELGNHSEFLGVMSRTEMLATFFVHDGGSTQDWRLKGHAAKEFWRWLASWAACLKRPSDLGYDDGAFVLPPMRTVEHQVEVGDDFAAKQGTLFVVEARTLGEQRSARRASLDERAAKAAEIIGAEPNEQWIVWGELNAETEALAAAIPGAIEVKGPDEIEEKERRIAAFVSGEARVLVSKASICCHGLNLQFCARMLFLGLSHSWEQWFQAVRRIYRFGQKREVAIHVVTCAADGAVVANLRRKQASADEMSSEMVGHMAAILKNEIRAQVRDEVHYRPSVEMTVPAWLRSEVVP